jgi:hypothetical protein
MNSGSITNSCNPFTISISTTTATCNTSTIHQGRYAK